MVRYLVHRLWTTLGVFHKYCIDSLRIANEFDLSVFPHHCEGCFNFWYTGLDNNSAFVVLESWLVMYLSNLLLLLLYQEICSKNSLVISKAENLEACRNWNKTEICILVNGVSPWSKGSWWTYPIAGIATPIMGQVSKATQQKAGELPDKNLYVAICAQETTVVSDTGELFVRDCLWVCHKPMNWCCVFRQPWVTVFSLVLYLLIARWMGSISHSFNIGNIVD